MQGLQRLRRGASCAVCSRVICLSTPPTCRRLHRSCTPIAVSFFDYLFYQRALPGFRSCCALLLITAGAIGYIINDREVGVNRSEAYCWVAIWFVVLVFQLTYGKFLVGGLKHKTLWTPVLYTNTFSVLPALTVALIAGELSSARLAKAQLAMTPTGMFWLILSCVIGICISWAGFWCQSVVTATTYAVRAGSSPPSPRSARSYLPCPALAPISASTHAQDAHARRPRALQHARSIIRGLAPASWLVLDVYHTLYPSSFLPPLPPLPPSLPPLSLSRHPLSRKSPLFGRWWG